MKVQEKGVIRELEGTWVAGWEEMLHHVTKSGTPPGQGHVCPGMNQARPGKTADGRPGIST